MQVVGPFIIIQCEELWSGMREGCSQEKDTEQISKKRETKVIGNSAIKKIVYI